MTSMTTAIPERQISGLPMSPSMAMRSERSSWSRSLGPSLEPAFVETIVYRRTARAGCAVHELRLISYDLGSFSPIASSASSHPIASTWSPRSAASSAQFKVLATAARCLLSRLVASSKAKPVRSWRPALRLRCPTCGAIAPVGVAVALIPITPPRGPLGTRSRGHESRLSGNGLWSSRWDTDPLGGRQSSASLDDGKSVVSNRPSFHRTLF